MASKRTDRNSKAKKAKKVMGVSPAPAPRSVFGQPLLLVGEDAAAFEQLRAQFRAAVRPVDIIEEMFVSAVVDLHWEILRWRRVKTSLLRTSVRSALKGFLSKTLELELFREVFELLNSGLKEELIGHFQVNSAEAFESLIDRYNRQEPDAVDIVDKVFKRADLNIEVVLDFAKDEKAIALVQAYARGEPYAIALVNELLAADGQTMDDLMADELSAGFKNHDRIDHLTLIERIDRLITTAEVRRDACLREVDRHRAALGEALRRNIENGEFEVIEPPSEGRNAA